MSPLSGLADDQSASWFAHLGRLVAQDGEPIYGFKGLRNFKQTSQPNWEPSYLSAPGSWSMPTVLARIAMLTNDGARLALQRSGSD